MGVPARRRLAAFALDLLFGLAPLVIAAPLVIPLLASERAVDVYAGQAVAAMLAAFGWLCFTAQQLWGLLRDGATWGRRRQRFRLRSSCGRLGLAARALVGPLVWAAALLSGLWPLLALWPAFYLLCDRGPADVLCRCEPVADGD